MSSGTVTSERRKKSRQRPLSLVYVELAHQNGGMMRDLSDEGFAVRTMMPIRVGDTTPFSFSLNETIRIEGDGAVVWVQDKGRVAGVKFTRLSSTARSQISRWLNGSDGAASENSATVKVAPTLEQLREELRASPPRPQASHGTEVPESPAAETTDEPDAAQEMPIPAVLEDVASAPLQEKSAVVPQESHESGMQTSGQIEAETVAEAETMAVPEETSPEPVGSNLAATEETEAEPFIEPQREHESAAMAMDSAPAESHVIANEPVSVPAEASSATEEVAPVLSEALQAKLTEVVAAAPIFPETSASEPDATAADAATVVPDALEAGAAKPDLGSQSKRTEPTPINVSSLFKPVSEIPEQHEQIETPGQMWRADGRLPHSESTRGTAPLDAGADAVIPITPPQSPREDSHIAEDNPPPPRTAPNLPRLALRLNAADYAKQGFPFAVGPLPPPPPGPGPAEPPKRFWATTPPSEPPKTDERPLSAALRDTFTGTTAGAVPPSQPTVQRVEHHQDAPILPDISSVLIQPSSAAPHENARQISAAEPLRPWPGQPPKKDSWADSFTLPRAVGIMLLLAVLLGVYTYRQELGQGLIWFGQLLSGNDQVQMQPQQAASPDQNGQNAQPAASTAPSSAQEPPQPQRTNAEQARVNESHPAEGPKNSANPPSPETVTQTPQPTKPKYTIQGSIVAGTDPPSAVAPETNAEPAQADYQQAMQILRGRYPGYSQAEAVKLLWSAVEKGNPNAELALADMYWHGKGVPRNCDQTRILLTAASRKGSAEAQKRLQEFQQEGCE